MDGGIRMLNLMVCISQLVVLITLIIMVSNILKYMKLIKNINKETYRNKCLIYDILNIIKKDEINNTDATVLIMNTKNQVYGKRQQKNKGVKRC